MSLPILNKQGHEGDFYHLKQTFHKVLQKSFKCSALAIYFSNSLN